VTVLDRSGSCPFVNVLSTFQSGSSPSIAQSLDKNIEAYTRRRKSERRFAAIEKEIPTVMKRDSGTARVTGYTQSAGDFT
jgi:hypothetical protein